jgi:hypothetical protein
MDEQMKIGWYQPAGLPYAGFAFQPALDATGPAAAGPQAADGLSFQQALTRWLSQSNGRQRPQETSQVDLLTVNPNLNLKLIQSLHPGAAIVQQHGHSQLQIPVPDLHTSHLHITHAVRWVADLDKLKLDGNKPTQPVALNLEQPFGKVIAPTALSATLMGQGVSTSHTSLSPDSIRHMLQGRVNLPPAEKAKKSGGAENQHSHFDKL